jgi:pyruvate dehydrogenase E1 component alpha subunit
MENFVVYDNETLLADRLFCLKVLLHLVLVRKFEERVIGLFGEGKIHGTAHLCIGEEATGIGTTFALKPEDCMLASHRGHGQAIGKGIPVNDIMAEMLGKQPGVNHGRGGSMHIADIKHGVLGANGIMGASAPLACGAALSFKKNKVIDRVAAVFFGDGSSNLGAIHESMNLAAAWKLRVMFVLINNTYGFSTPLHKVVNDTDLTKRAIPYGMKSYEVDGNDVLAVYRAASQAREYMVKNNEPVLIVENTYRTAGHSKSDKNRYRTQEEIDEWKAKNPISRFIDLLLENGYTQNEIDDADRNAAKMIEDAVEYAESSPEPKIRDFEAAVYAL